MKPKRLPRLWCALQGLLPIDACEAAQRAELAWPRDDLADGGKASILPPAVAPKKSVSPNSHYCRQ